MSNAHTMLRAFLFIVASVYIATAQDVISQPETSGSERSVNSQSNSFAGAVNTTENDEGDDRLRRFEVGGHFTYLQFGTFDPQMTREWRDIAPFPPNLPFRAPDKNPKDPGVGVRFSYNVSRYIAIEVEANWLFQKDRITRLPLINQSANTGGNKFQMLFGPKIGKRWKKFGVFGKIRPGFIHFNRYPVVEWIQQVPPGHPFLSLASLRKAKFLNVDVGGVFEYYPSKRTILRFDMGDTIVRYNRQEPKEFNPTFTRHNLQMNLGFGFRF